MNARTRLRGRQMLDRASGSQRLLSQVEHPSRLGHLPEGKRLLVAIHSRAAAKHLERVAELLEEGADE